MGDQLWYTWSDKGFDLGVGHQVRAASQGLTGSGRIQAFMKHLPYVLPQGSKANAVTPEEAPLTLAFIKVGQERILVNKTYVGLDRVQRAGAHFSHLVAGLPAVRSPRTGEIEEFSAQDAIELWKSGFWRAYKASEEDKLPRKLVLEEVTSKDLQQGTLTVRDVLKVKEFLPFVIKAFLTISTLGGQKRLYIAAPSETVAALIWGLTHCLPRTLQAMRELTFSTYEKDVDNSPATIIGTCWLPAFRNDSRGVPYDLPQSCYQGKGLAINCYTNRKSAELSDDPRINKFAEFATRCFVEGNMGELDALLLKTERKHITDVPAFLWDFITSPPLLEKEDVLSILKTIPPEPQTLNEENVLNSIIYWIGKDQASWSEYERELVKLRQLVDANPGSGLAVPLSSLAKKMVGKVGAAINANEVNAALFWRKALTITTPIPCEPEVLAYLLQNLSQVNYTQPYKQWWDEQGEATIERLRPLAGAPHRGDSTKALNSFISRAATDLRTAITSNDSPVTSFWGDVLAISAPPSSESGTWAWTYLLQGFSGNTLGFRAFQEWWNSQGARALQYLCRLTKVQSIPDLAADLTAFALKVVEEIQTAIKNDYAENYIYFCAKVLETVTPFSGKLDVWTELLRGFSGQMIRKTAFQRWWNAQGETVFNDLRGVANKNPTITGVLSGFISSVKAQLQQAIKDDNGQDTSYWQKVFAISAPVTSEPLVWIALLQDLLGAIRTRAYNQWWNEQGRDALRNLRRLADNDSNVAGSLSAFSGNVVRELHDAITNNRSENTSFRGEVLAISAPAYSDSGIWVFLLRNFSAEAIRTPAFRQWWNNQGKGVTRDTGNLAHSNPEITAALTTFSLRALMELQAAMKNDPPSISFWQGVLGISAPQDVWIDLPQRLLKEIPAHKHVYEIYPWEFRAWLLQMWNRIPALAGSQHLHYWLDVQWREVDKLLKLGLIPDWQKIAVSRLLTSSSTPNIPAQDVAILVSDHASLFYEALQYLLQMPTSQQAAMRFFAFLMENGYPEKILLTSIMLAATANDSNIAEKIVAWARLEPYEIEDLLENYSQEMLAKNDVPPALVSLVRQYIHNFNVDDLDRQPARYLLRELQEKSRTSSLPLPNDLLAAIQGWCNIGEFIDEPLTSRNRLRDLRHAILGIRNLPQSALSSQTKLADKLLPILTDCVSSEADLTRTIDNLGSLLIRSGTPELLMLQRMAALFGESYDQEQPPRRVIAYIKLVLGEADSLESPQKEQFIDYCLAELLKIDQETIEILAENASQWPSDLESGWDAFVSRQTRLVPEVTHVAATTPEYYWVEPNRFSWLKFWRWSLFLWLWSKLPGGRNVAARIRFRNALRNQLVRKIAEDYDRVLENDEKITRDERDRLQLAQDFVTAYDSTEDERIASASNAIKISVYHHQLQFTQEEEIRIQLAKQRMAGLPPLPDNVVKESELDAVVTIDGQHPVAIVNGQSISLEVFSKTQQIEGMYLQYRIDYLEMLIEEERSNKKKQQLLSEVRMLREELQQLRSLALYDLIDDILIREGIKELIGRGVGADKLDIKVELSAAFNDFREYVWTHESFYQLFRSNQLAEKNLEHFLRMMLRRERLTRYLQDEGRELDDWLEAYKEQAQINIWINKTLVGIEHSPQ